MRQRDDQQHQQQKKRPPEVPYITKSQELEQRIQRLEQKLIALQAQLDHFAARKFQS